MFLGKLWFDTGMQEKQLLKRFNLVDAESDQRYLEYKDMFKL